METEDTDPTTQQQSPDPSREETALTQVLHQFSCLGTTDKDVLVAQLQKLIGPQLNSSAAQFFLDMNNWNLQLAVGAYFDLTTEEPHRMQLIHDLNDGVEVIITPYTKFIKSWKINNNGQTPWPVGSFLKFKSGDQMAVQNQIYINPVVQPSETRQVSVEFLSPHTTGTYNSRWQMCTPEGYLFGDEIWLIVQVVQDATAAITQDLVKLSCDQMEQQMMS